MNLKYFTNQYKMLNFSKKYYPNKEEKIRFINLLTKCKWKPFKQTKSFSKDNHMEINFLYLLKIKIQIILKGEVGIWILNS